ncbi:MAG: hypothetical protein AAGG38_03675 [Planctomycetota bacterium]
MNKRYTLVGGGVAAALAIVAAAAFLGSPAQTRPAGPEPAPPTISSPGVTYRDLERPERDLGQPVEVVRQFEIYREDPDRSVTRFSAAEVSPLADFVADAVEPAAELRFPSGRVLLITADRGKFFHPGNQPTRGEFQKHTVVTQFQPPPGQAADLTSDRHVQFRLYLDDTTTFDRQRGHVRSTGPVRLVAPDLDFTGTGLDLTFNLLADRIERLVIEKGDLLRLAPSSNLNPTPGVGGDPGIAAGDAEPAASSSSSGSDAASTQPYLAVLQDELTISIGQNEATLQGDRLEVQFTLNPPGSAVDAPPGSTARAAPAFDREAPFYVSTDSPRPDGRALLAAGPDDILVQWSGPLVLTPLEDTDLSTRDARLTILGSPAQIDTQRDERITAARVGYTTTRKRVFAQGSPDHPLVVSAPDLGTLTGDDLWIEQASARGEIAGPGSLVSGDQQLTVEFSDRLDLAFAPDADGRLDAIESASFIGNVHALANHPDPQKQLDLTAQTLSLALTRDVDGNAQPTHLHATGTPEQPVLALQPSTTFRAQQLNLDLAPTGPGRASPSGPASEASAARPLSPSASGEASGEPEPDQNFEVVRLRALGQVFVKLTDPGNEATLTAHALDADPRINRLELFGQNDQSPATLIRSDATLTGVHLVLLQNEQSAHALGPGTFSAQLDPAEPSTRLNITWSQSMDFSNAQGTALFLGRVDAASTSPTDDTSLTSVHRLDLEFVPQFSASEASYADPPLAAETGPTALDLRRARALADPDDPDQQVQFTAQTFDQTAPRLDGQPTRPLTRITLIGHEILFVNQPPNRTNQTPVDDHLAVEQVIIPTRGHMLLENYRPAASENPDALAPGESAAAADPQANAEPAPDGPAVNFAGQGVTVFAWGKKMVLDALANDLRLEQDVFMLHRPAAPQTASGGEDPDPADQTPLKLDAQRLVADLTETGGLGAYLAGTAPKAQIRSVKADGQVRVARGDANIVADHLEYDQAERYALFWAEPRREVLLTQADTTTAARQFRWDLDQNQFTAVAPNAGVIPIE